MQAPRKDAAYPQIVRYGIYVEAKLVLYDEEEALTENVKDATQKVLDSGRAIEDHNYGSVRLIAARDARDDALDTTTREAALELRSRGLSAAKEAPYTLIYPKKVSHYTTAPLGVQQERYNELILRLETHLPVDDPVRVEAVPKLTATLAQWVEAVAALRAYRNAGAIKATDMDQADEDWRRVIRKTYGHLITEHEIAGAERFFPRQRRRSAQSSQQDTPDTDDPLLEDAQEDI